MSTALDNNKIDLVELLLERGADPKRSSLSGSGYTPIYITAQHGHATTVKTLIAANVDLDNDMYNALYAAAANNHLDIVIDLLVAGADPNIAMRKAVENMRSDVVSVIQEALQTIAIRRRGPVLRAFNIEIEEEEKKYQYGGVRKSRKMKKTRKSKVRKHRKTRSR